MSTSNHLVVFTPHALTVGNGVSPSPNDISEVFAQRLAAKAQAELGLFSVATKSMGDKDLDATFDNFTQALELSDCAIFVIPGSKICLLDAIYPRLLVLLTMQPWWVKKMLLVCLGEMATNGKKFDPLIFQHTPVFFSASPSNWNEEIGQWKEVMSFIKLAIEVDKVEDDAAYSESANGIIEDNANEAKPTEEDYVPSSEKTEENDLESPERTGHSASTENTAQQEVELKEPNNYSHPDNTAETPSESPRDATEVAISHEKSEHKSDKSNKTHQPSSFKEAETRIESSGSATKVGMTGEKSVTSTTA
uniref:FMN_red domain-containing protein n=1 Tax=Mesocestoides corti TaxID=53468 RepID=A0A5K3FEX3_MESCO